MKVISIHSHKGGAGKTTLTLIMAKLLAMNNYKVCAVDLDFIGAGFCYSIGSKNPKRYLDEYIARDVDSEEIPQLEELITKYTDEEMGKKEFNLIYNLGGLLGNQRDLNKAHKIAVNMVGREVVHGNARYSVRRLCSELEKNGFDFIILDCQPGLANLSKGVMKLAAEGKNEHITVYVTTGNRSHFYGLLNELNHLATDMGEKQFIPEKSMLIVNRIIWDMKNDIKTIIKYCNKKEKIKKVRSYAVLSLFEQVVTNNYNLPFATLEEDRMIMESASIGGKGEIVLPTQAKGKEFCKKIVEVITGNI